MSYELKSLNTNERSFVKFINKTQRIIQAIWINYRGQPVLYKSLRPGEFMDTNTYVTHPWIFRDSRTDDLMAVGSKFVYFPTAWQQNDLERVGGDLMQVTPRRTQVLITLPMFSLRDRAMQIVQDYVMDHKLDTTLLELPLTLRNELESHLKYRGYQNSNN